MFNYGSARQYPQHVMVVPFVCYGDTHFKKQDSLSSMPDYMTLTH